MRKIVCLFLFLVLPLGPSFSKNKSADPDLKPIPIAIPGGEFGIGFDDLVFASPLHAMLVPSGRTGKLNLIDVDTNKITSITGFSEGSTEQKGHEREGGTTSADEGLGFIFATDHAKKVIDIVDPSSKVIIASSPLAGGSDYVRYVSAANEVWVTDPRNQQIEVFSFSKKPAPGLAHSMIIPVPGGPESLAVDGVRQRVYTNLWAGITMAIDIKTHEMVAQWTNTCEGSRGIAIDEKRGFLFIAGKEGKLVVLDLNANGRVLSSIQSDPGADIISYNPMLAHLYCAAGPGATMAIVGVSANGQLSLLGVANTARGCRGAVADDRNNVWVTDPEHGQLLLFRDVFPKTN